MPLPAAPPAELHAGGWLLSALSPQDWPLEQALSRQPDVVRWTLYPADLSEADARARIEGMEQRAVEGDGRRYRITADGEAVGTAGIVADADGECEVFYALLPAGRHRGAATAAARALTDWALSHGARRVTLLTIRGITASEAVALRAGFVPHKSEQRAHRGVLTDLTRWTHASTSASQGMVTNTPGQPS